MPVESRWPSCRPFINISLRSRFQQKTRSKKGGFVPKWVTGITDPVPWPDRWPEEISIGRTSSRSGLDECLCGSQSHLSTQRTVLFTSFMNIGQSPTWNFDMFEKIVIADHRFEVQYDATQTRSDISIARIWAEISCLTDTKSDFCNAKYQIHLLQCRISDCFNQM